MRKLRNLTPQVLARKPDVIQKMTDSGRLPVPWTTTWSWQCISWARQVWVKFWVQFWGVLGKIPLNGKFTKIPSDTFRGDTETCRGRIWWKSVVGKLTKCRIVIVWRTKTPAAWTRPSFPFCPHWANRVQIFLSVVAPKLCMFVKFGPDRRICPVLKVSSETCSGVAKGGGA